MKYAQEVEGDDGWTRWIHPAPVYKMSCCDCGLVHKMEFKVTDCGQIAFRAARDERATGQKRRRHSK